MEIIVSCLRGIEDVCIKEINELIKKKACKSCGGRILVKCNEADLAKLSGFLRSGIRICELFSKLNFDSIDDISKESLKFSKELESPIAVRCSRFGNHEFHSSDVEKAVGKALFESGLKVNLREPRTTFVVDIVNNECFLGVLKASGLNKREYRIKATSQSVNATIGYALVRLSGWKKGKTLLDPFSKDGTIAIEAASFEYKLPLKYEKSMESKNQLIFCFDPMLNNVNNSETNAKLAGVNKAIKFSRYDIEWLDTRFGKNEIDYIIGILPHYSAERKKDMDKLYTGLFYQAEFILSKTGKMALLSQSGIKSFIGKFKVVSERKVISGDLEYNLILLKK